MVRSGIALPPNTPVRSGNHIARPKDPVSRRMPLPSERRESSFQRLLRCRARMAPPLHLILLMRALASMNGTVSRMVQHPDAAATDWNWLMATLRHLAHDPNWRKSPSVLDTIQGLTAPPGRKRNQKAKPQSDPAS